MISDKSFTPQEFQVKIKEFAQEFINRINTPGVNLELRQEGPLKYLMVLDKPNGNEAYQLWLNQEGKVETIRVLG